MESLDGKLSENRLPTLISGMREFKLLETWPDDAQYQAFQLMVSNMQVVNDIAERE